jgi:zinc protease
LANGLSIILRPISGAPSVALVTLYSIGADHDPEGRSGLAHLTEHFYPTAAAGSTSARSFEQLMTQYPAGWNAQTGARYTVFAAVFPKESLDDELADAAARMGDLKVTDSELMREKTRLVSEVGNMFGGFPPLAAFNHASERVRPTPLGGRRAGLTDHVNAITAEEAQDLWRRYYKPANALLVLAGGFEAAGARSAITEKFSDIPSGESVPSPYPSGEPKLGGTEEIHVRSLQRDATPQVCLAYEAPSPGDDNYAPFLILVARLWLNASKLGLQPNEFPVKYAPLDNPEMIALVVPITDDETTAQTIERLRGFVAETVEPKLSRRDIVETKAAFGFLLGLADMPDQVLAQNPYGIAFGLGRRAQLGINPAELAQAIDSLTENDLGRAVGEIFAQERSAAVAILLDRT